MLLLFSNYYLLASSAAGSVLYNLISGYLPVIALLLLMTILPFLFQVSERARTKHEIFGIVDPSTNAILKFEDKERDPNKYDHYSHYYP